MPRQFPEINMVSGWQAWRLVYVAVVAAVLCAHLPELTGWVTCNPVYRDHGLLAHDPIGVLPGSCSMDSNDGTTLQALGGRAANMWLHGRLPWWNSDAGLGLPLAAEGQPPAFFLPFVLLLHFVSGIVLLKLTMQMLAGAAAVALFRELGLARAAAAVGGILFALNGSFAWYAHSPVLPIAFLPALLFGLERSRLRAAAGQAGGPVWIALALAYSLVSGFPETAFLDGLLAAVWAVAALFRLPVSAWRRFALKIAAGGLAGLALAAPAWISFVDYLGISSVGLHALVIGDHLEASQAITLLLPGIYGPPFADFVLFAWGQDGGFFGPALVLLAIMALAGGARYTALRWVMAGWIAFWISVFYGFPPTHALWAAFRPLNEVQVTRYAFPSLECAAAVLAALAVDDWRRAGHSMHVRWAALVFTLLLAAGIALALPVHRLPPQSPAAWSYAALSVLEALLCVGALLWLLRMPATHRRVLVLAALVTIDAGLHFAPPELAGAHPGKLALQPVAFLRENAGTARVYSLSEQLPTNYGSWLGVPSIQADSIPYSSAWDAAAAAIGGDVNMANTSWLVITPASQLAAFRAAATRLRGAGVRYVITDALHDPFIAAPEPGMSVAYQDARTRIYELSNPAPYFSVAAGGPCRLDVASREHLATVCDTPALLIRRELNLPGWRARVKDAKAAVVAPDNGPQNALDGFLQAVWIPAGKANIRFRYAPPHADLMAWLFLIGLVGTGGLMVFPRFKR
jgi:hypothetical protein